MKHTIEQNQNGINVEVTEIKGKEDELLKSFQECREGRCKCPTQEYKKLDSLVIERNAGGIRLRLKSKPGEVFDDAEIKSCLLYTDMMSGDKK